MFSSSWNLAVFVTLISGALSFLRIQRLGLTIVAIRNVSSAHCRAEQNQQEVCAIRTHDTPFVGYIALPTNLLSKKGRTTGARHNPNRIIAALSRLG